MKQALLKLKDKIIGVTKGYDYPDEFGEDYLEIDGESKPQIKQKVVVKPFVIHEFSDIKPTLDSLREGYTISLINIKPLKSKDLIELKRVVNKLKKTCDAIGGDIAGFGEDWLVVTPGFAEVYRNQQTETIKEDPSIKE
ncbi:cell division protein SepF [Candidatus Woesearchaeota archaeon]|nr:cell division protein SepF [Candidatus Woesearchaeota archaeon]